MANKDNLYIKIDGISNRDLNINMVNEPSIISPLHGFEKIESNSNYENYTRKINQFEPYTITIQFMIFNYTESKLNTIKEWIIGNGYKKIIEFGFEPGFYHIGTIAEEIEFKPSAVFNMKTFDLKVELEPIYYLIAEDEYTIIDNFIIDNQGNINSKPLMKLIINDISKDVKFNINADCYLKLKAGHNQDIIYIDFKHSLIYDKYGNNLMKYLDYMGLQDFDDFVVLNDITNMYFKKGRNTIGEYPEADNDKNIKQILIKNQSCFI